MSTVILAARTSPDLIVWGVAAVIAIVFVVIDTIISD